MNDTSDNPSTTSFAQSSRTEAEMAAEPFFEPKDIENPSDRKLFPVTDLDRGLVGWEGQDDRNNPQNFPSSKKWGLLMLVSAITFISPLASSMFSPAVSYVAKDLHVSDETLLSFSVSIYLLGYAVSRPIF